MLGIHPTLIAIPSIDPQLHGPSPKAPQQTEGPETGSGFVYPAECVGVGQGGGGEVGGLDQVSCMD